jgi:hypothetical protein
VISKEIEKKNTKRQQQKKKKITPEADVISKPMHDNGFDESGV